MQKSLRTRLTVIFLAISTIPLLLAALVRIQQDAVFQTRLTISQQDEISRRVAEQTENYINDAAGDLRTLTDVLNIQDMEPEEQRRTLTNVLSFSNVYSEISLVNSSGAETIKVSRNAIVLDSDLQNIKNNPAFSDPARTGQAYYGDIIFDEEKGLPYMYIGIPIVNLVNENVTGVLVSKLRLQAIWTFVSAATKDDLIVYMTDITGRIVAHSNPSIALQGKSFIPPEEGMLVNGLNETTSILGHADAYLANEKFFVVIAELPWAVGLSSTIQSAVSTLTIILLTLGIISLLSLRITRSFTSPIEELAQAANSIQQGDLNTRVTINSSDEIGLLGESFNSMALQLQRTLSGLEAHVADRTHELEESLAENRQRSAQLEAIAVAARTIATLDNVDELLPNIAQLVSERFGFYHVGIFLLDAENKYAILRAANSAGGQAMIARAHKLRIGKEGVVGYAVSEKQAHIALDVGEDAIFFDNPELPNTHSEMALPLLLGDKVIGALDIQSEKSSAFTKDDTEVLSTLADQIAVAIENARLFEQSRETLQELEKTFQQYVRTEWKRFIDASTVKGYIAQPASLKTISTSFQKDDKKGKSDTTYQVPVKLRDVVIGHVNIDLDKPVAEYSEDELEIIHAAVERFTLALENARLLETTSRRARRERLVSEVTSKIRSTNDPDKMVKTAMEELKNILGANKVELKEYLPKVEKAEDSGDA